MYRQSIEQLGLHHQQELEARLNKNSIHYATIELSLNAVVTLMGSKFTPKANDDNIVVYFRNSIQSKTKTIGCKASHSKHLVNLLVRYRINVVVTLMGSKFTAKANDDNIVEYF